MQVTTRNAPATAPTDPLPKPAQHSTRWRFLAGVATSSLILSACVGPTVVTEKFPANELPVDPAPSGSSYPTGERPPEGLAGLYTVMRGWGSEERRVGEESWWQRVCG